MAENQLYLVLPIASDNALDEEQVYLKVLDASASSEEFENILKRVVAAFSWVEDEEYVLYYDHGRFRDLYNKCSLEVQNQRPSPVQLLSILKQMIRIPDQMFVIKVNHVSFDKGIICGYINQNGEGLVDDNALSDGKYIKIENQNGHLVKIVILDCRREDIFQWFVKNRASVRMIDSNYAKHGLMVKGESKEAISARTYTDSEYQDMLPWAVGGNGCRRKYYMDKERGRLVIFWNENLSTPTYHYYDVDIDDPQENAKMWQECGRNRVEQIRKVSEIRQSNNRSDLQ